MTKIVLEWLQSTFTANPHWVTAIISIIPMIEVRGAITVGISLGLNEWVAWALASSSSIVVCPILLFFLKPILNLLKKVKIFKFLAQGMEDMFASRAKKLKSDSETGTVSEKTILHRKIVGVFLFVAIPLPMTGVWTGSAVSAFLDLKYRYSVPAIIIGNFVSGLLIMLLNMILGEHATLILFILLIFVLISIISVCTAVILRYKKKQKATAGEIESENKTETEEVEDKKE